MRPVLEQRPEECFVQQMLAALIRYAMARRVDIDRCLRIARTRVLDEHG